MRDMLLGGAAVGVGCVLVYLAVKRLCQSRLGATTRDYKEEMVVGAAVYSRGNRLNLRMQRQSQACCSFHSCVRSFDSLIHAFAYFMFMHAHNHRRCRHYAAKLATSVPVAKVARTIRRAISEKRKLRN